MADIVRVLTGLTLMQSYECEEFIDHMVQQASMYDVGMLYHFADGLGRDAFFDVVVELLVMCEIEHDAVVVRQAVTVFYNRGKFLKSFGSFVYLFW